MRDKNKRYDVSKEIKEAIEKFFSLPEIAFAPEHGFMALGYDTIGMGELGLAPMKP